MEDFSKPIQVYDKFNDLLLLAIMDIILKGVYFVKIVRFTLGELFDHEC